MKITSKGIITFISVGLILSFVGSALISKILSTAITNDTAEKEIEFVLGAIEAGPLTIARLQASAISQRGLQDLMNNPSLARRNLRTASIDGGPNFSFNYGSWASKMPIMSDCLKKYEKTIQYKDSLNPFRIAVSRDVCLGLPEARAIFTQSVIASLLVTVLAAFILGFSVWPVTKSIRQAEELLENSGTVGLEIPFIPIKNLVEKARHNIELEKQAARADVIRQIAHDIRSPLSALNIVLGNSNTISFEEKELVKNVSNRINDVANNLLEANIGIARNSRSEKFTDVLKVLKTVFDEKKALLVNHTGIEIQLQYQEDVNFNAAIESSTLARILSNLINNSIESIVETGIIQLAANELKNSAVITVHDNGCGMSEDTLAKLGNQNFSTKKLSKNSGSGLGFWHAKNAIEEAGGSIEIQSRQGIGTLITISLPLI